MKSSLLHTEAGSPRRKSIPRARESPPTPERRKDRGSSRHSDLPIPPPPKVEPTPPTKVVTAPKGNRYTIEDKKYFSKYISWALQNDPSLTKGELVEKLAENVRKLILKPELGFSLRFSQVPHHTANSWSSYWARDPLADRLLAVAREGATRARSGEKEEVDVEDDQETAEEESSHDSDENEATSDRGHFFSAAEVRTMAKYIARYNPDDWAMMTGKQRWLPFYLEVTLSGDHIKAFANLKLFVQHPRRSENSYTMKYRSKEQGMCTVGYCWYEIETSFSEFLKLAEGYRRRALQQQRGTPSWANASGRKPLASP